MLRVPWTAKQSNEVILRTAKSKRKIINKVRTQQARFIGHVMRKKKLEQIVTTGKIEGKRSRGRQRIKIIDSLSTWCGRSTTELLQTTHDRAVWRAMIANACDRHGT